MQNGDKMYVVFVDDEQMGMFQTLIEAKRCVDRELTAQEMNNRNTEGKIFELLVTQSWYCEITHKLSMFQTRDD